MEYTLLKATDNAQGQFDSNIGPSNLSIVLGTGEGALFPEIIRDSATSAGDESTLNSTGIGASGVEVGDFIENLTDGSHAYVISVSTNSVQTTTLQGGVADVWDSADEWVVGRFEVTLNSRNVTSGAIEDYEIVRISDRSGDTLTVETGDRGMRSTTAQSWEAGDYVNLFVGAEQMEGIYRGLAEMALDINSLQSTKADVTYVDAALASRNWKQHVVAASTANGTLATDYENGDTLDGVTLATGDRILLKDQTTTSENGIYVVAASGAPTRATDFDVASEVTSALVAVRGGTTNADSVWLCTSDAPVVGTDPIAFSAFTPASVASEAEAIAGTSNTKMMTPLRVAQYYAGQTLVDGTAGEAIDGSTTPVIVAQLGNNYRGRVYYQAGTTGRDLMISNYSSTTVNFGNTAANSRVAFSFTETDALADTITLREVLLEFDKQGSPSDNVYIEIYADSGGAPTGAALGTSDLISGSSIPAARECVNFTFSTPCTITSGTLYHVVFRRSGSADAVNYYVLQRLSGGSVSGSTTQVYDSGTGLWSGDLGTDLNIAITFGYDYNGKIVAASYNDLTRANVVGVTTDNVGAGDPITYHPIGATLEGFTGLVEGVTYYLSTSGTWTATPTYNYTTSGGMAYVPVLKALTSTKALILGGWKEARYVGASSNALSSDAGSSGPNIDFFLELGFLPDEVELWCYFASAYTRYMYRGALGYNIGSLTFATSQAGGLYSVQENGAVVRISMNDINNSSFGYVAIAHQY